VVFVLKNYAYLNVHKTIQKYTKTPPFNTLVVIL